MPRRPLPNIPRLAHPRRRPAETLLLACPRIDPDWELAALHALLKPQTKDAILHRNPQQTLPPDAPRRIDRTLDAFAALTGYRAELHRPPAGDFHFAAAIPAPDLPHARALALALSHALPDTWLTLGRLFARNARFFRRERGSKLHLVPATNVHLSRDLRRACQALTNR